MLSRLRRLDWLFWITVAIPTALAVLYYGLIASDVYISESRFVVRSPDKPAVTGIGTLLKTAGFSNAGEEVFAAQDYIKSRDALRALDRDGAVRRAYTAAHVSIVDRFDPLGLDNSFEELFLYYKRKVDVSYDTNAAIAVLTVRAFTPGEARLINERLLGQAEGLVNQLNARGRGDLVRLAEKEVVEARAAARDAAAALAAYRNRAGVVDPERQAAVQLQMISQLQSELIGARTQLSQLRRIAPASSQIPALQTRIQSLEREIAGQSGSVAGDRGSLSAEAAQFQRLQLQREFADKQLGAALASLQEARNEERRQRAYVERIAQPSLPDEAAEPRRVRGILAAFVLGLIAWGVLSMLLAGMREHKD